MLIKKNIFYKFSLKYKVISLSKVKVICIEYKDYDY